MGNSIEEDIAKVNTYIELVLEKDYCNCNELNTILGKHCDGSKNVAYAMQHILSDYKKVLKENEILKEEKEQAWEEWNNLEQGSYETELKLKEENRELKAEMKDGVIAIKLNALQTENEKLKNKLLDTLEGQKVIKEEKPQYIKENFIPVEKVKNKIEHYQKLQHNYIEKYDEINEGLQAMISALQELLESEE